MCFDAAPWAATACRNGLLQVALASIVTAGACNKLTPGTSEYLDSAPGTCEIAAAPDFVITKADAMHLRRNYVPAIPLPEATRWALDIALSEWKTGEPIGEGTVSQRVRRYRAHLTTVDGDVRGTDVSVAEVFGQYQQEASVTLGPCYVQAEPQPGPS